MLKAVRFDEEEHKELIEYVENYRDKKNKPNHSEAIRLLMQKGLETLRNSKPKEELNIESLKQDIINQIMSQINTQQVPKHQPAPLTQNNMQSNIKEKPQGERPPSPPPQKPKSSPPKVNANPLLANILGNSQR
jgi:hypothetical protein